jgi:hypothetical protein
MKKLMSSGTIDLRINIASSILNIVQKTNKKHQDLNKNLYLLREIYDEEGRRGIYNEWEVDPVIDTSNCEVKNLIKTYLRKLRQFNPIEYKIDGKCDHNVDNEKSNTAKLILLMIWFTEF